MSTIRIKGDTSGYVDLASSSNGGNLTIGNGTTDTVHVDNANGRVGIGNATPTSTLHLGTGYTTFQMGANDSTGFHWAKDTTALNLYTGVNGAGNKRFGVSTDGFVTMPHQPAFFCRPPAGFSTSGQTQITGTWDLSGGGFNTGNHFNLSNGSFTAPVSGVYAINWAALVSTNNARLDFYVVVNGNQRMREEVNGYSTTQTNRSGSVHGILNLAANDVVTFYIGNFSGTPQEIYSGARIPWSYASGFLLG